MLELGNLFCILCTRLVMLLPKNADGHRNTYADKQFYFSGWYPLIWFYDEEDNGRLEGTIWKKSLVLLHYPASWVSWVEWDTLLLTHSRKVENSSQINFITIRAILHFFLKDGSNKEQRNMWVSEYPMSWKWIWWETPKTIKVREGDVDISCVNPWAIVLENRNDFPIPLLVIPLKKSFLQNRRTHY